MILRKVFSIICSIISIITLIAFFSEVFDYLDILDLLEDFDLDLGIPFLVFVGALCILISSIPFFMCFYPDHARRKLLKRSNGYMIANIVLTCVLLVLTEDVLESIFFEIFDYFQARFLVASFELIREYFLIITIAGLVDSIITYFSVKNEINSEFYPAPPVYYNTIPVQAPFPQNGMATYNNPPIPQNMVPVYNNPPIPQNAVPTYNTPPVPQNGMQSCNTPPAPQSGVPSCNIPPIPQSGVPTFSDPSVLQVEEPNIASIPVSQVDDDTPPMPNEQYSSLDASPNEQPTNIQEDSKPKTKLCPFCETEHSEATEFCNYCGMKLK